MSKIAIILGTRPEIIKMSPVIRGCIKQNLDYFIIHSNQHYSKNMDEVFFEELGLPKVKYNLNISSSLHGEMTAQIILASESILIKEKPDWVLVQGDTNTVLAGALTASKLGIRVGHIEAGLRSYDRTMPEEINRVVTDHISDKLFVPTEKQAKILTHEGIAKNNIVITGNTIVDAVYQNLSLMLSKTNLEHYRSEKYFLLTLHRPVNVDIKKNLTKIISTIETLSRQYGYPVYFPIHPRTKKQINLFNIKINPKYLKLMSPVGYLEMLAMEVNSKLIFTDSGGIQEESCILKTPSITLRENTERPETLDVGSTILTGLNQEKIIQATKIMLKKKRKWPNPFGDGKAWVKILHEITQSS